MTTIDLLGIVIVTLLVGVIAFRIIPAISTYFLYRGKRIVTCPETFRREAVDVAARKAAVWSLIGDPKLRLDRCSRWPERHDCGQECLKMIEADPDNCLVWKIVSNWYEGQSCVYCHKRFTVLSRLDHAPALLRDDHTTIEWNQISPEQLPEIFSTSEPVCWNCHITETFRREHPELVVERNR